MAERVKLTSKDGTEIQGALALPAGTGKAPGLVLIQEWWGLTAHIDSLVDRFAGFGFVTLAPDLYRGVTAKDAGEAQKLMTDLDGARALGDIAGAVAFLGKHARVTGPTVGVTGFCMGGAYAIASSTHIAEIGAVASFYGIPPETNINWSGVHAPIQKHVAKRDNWVTPAAAEALKAKVEAHGGAMEIHLYDADHAFVNDTRPEVYAKDQAELALERAAEFLHAKLG